MKVIIRDNYDRDTHDDTLICSEVDEWYGPRIRSFLQATYGNEHDYYDLVPDDYVLKKFEP